jgi:endothelin-converting enzyme/putative endopeptidase
MSKTLKKVNTIKNKTKRKQDKILKSVSELSNQQREIICGKSANIYTPFEKKINELFEKNKIDVESASYNLGKEVVKDLKQAVSPSNITAQDDFYSYINERWLEGLDIEAYQQYSTQIDNFRLVQDKVYRELIEIIENYINDNNTKNTQLGKCLKNAYESFKGYNTRQQTRCLSAVVVKYIDEQLSNPDNLWYKLATANTNEIMSWGAPFVWSINPDDKNPKIYKCYLEPPQLSLIDIEIYIDDPADDNDIKSYKNLYRQVFLKYLDEVFIAAFGNNHGFNVKDVYDCEYELLNAMACDLFKNENEDGYNLITKKEAMELFGFNWEEFCKGLGFKKIPEDFVTSNVNYLLCGTKLLKEKWNSPKWRTYWIYLYIRQQIRWDEDGWKVFFKFEGKFMRGQESPVDPYIRPIFSMGFTFNTFLTNQYILHYKNEQSVNYVKSMAEDLKIVFKRIINRNNWMEPNTKECALDKLENIKLIVGSPSILREDPLLDYKADDPWGNLVKIANWRHEQALELVGKSVIDIPVMDWSEIPPKFISTQAYVVNAMYTPTENTIYVPLAYIQKPFVDLDERGIEYNLAHIGFTIAHELSHALDDFGSKYNKYGQLENWWTEKDKKEFKKIQSNIVKQYEVFASYDDIHFDAWPTIGESLADIAGFSICQEYLRDFQLKNEDILPIQSLSFTAFFVYFAIQSRQKISDKAILAQLKTNPHPLDKYRCNVPLSRSRIFRAIYHIEKGDKMWWSSLNNIWSD